MSPLSGKRAVIVEDDSLTVILFQRALKSAGVHIVGTARDAQEGIDLVLKERPDLVLMDIDLPGGFNGIEAAKRILAQFWVCIVMLTVYSTHEYQEAAGDFEPCGFISKPVSTQRLLPTLEEAYDPWSKRSSETGDER